MKKAVWRIWSPRLKCPHCGGVFLATYAGRWSLRRVGTERGTQGKTAGEE